VTLAAAIRKRLSAAFELEVSFAITPGITILFGGSGSGKTTLLHCLAGLIRPDRGRVAIDDHALFDAALAIDVDVAERRLGYVFQHLALFPHLTVAENLAYGLARLAASDRADRAARIADSFGIGRLLDRRPAEISGGERQRVALARSLVTEPVALLLDEPLAALDHATQSRIIADLRRWNRDRAVPILYVTHAHREVFALGERVLVLHDGRIVADGPPHDVMDAPTVEPLAQVAGFENLLTTRVTAARRDAGVMSCRVSGSALDLEVPFVDRPPGSDVRVAIRAGDILVATERPRGLSARNVVQGRVVSIAREGRLVRLRVDAGAPFEVHVTPGAQEALGLGEGQSVWIVIKTHSCRIVSTL
jgi:molybdate transport system ATP-binding protein